MRIKLLIGTGDPDYSEHLSSSISKHHADVIDATVCGTPERVRDALKARKYDAALLEAAMIEGADISQITLPLLLTTEDDRGAGMLPELKEIKKYQRISSIVADVLEQCARVSSYGRSHDVTRARITAVWSPAGGVGATAVALAYAAKKASEGKQTLYLNLEPFSSVPAYFDETGKSISSVFEMLDSKEGDAQMLIRGIQRQDACGITYFCRPVNFDDMNVLSAGNISSLIGACAGVTDELVVDLSCVCDERTRRVFDIADRVYLVTDSTRTALVKVSQFATQHKIFESIREKAVLVENKGAETGIPYTETSIRLPLIQSADPSVVYKALSANF